MYGRDAARLYASHTAALAEEIDALDGLDRELAEGVGEIDRERIALCAALAAVYLPALTEDALADAERRTGTRVFSQRKPLDVLPREANKLQGQLVRLEADERWSRREALVGPHGEWTRQLAEAKDLADPWERDCARFEALEGFLELVEVRYDTPAFEERWWQPSYWRHWALGDAICEALGLADFGDDVLPAYEKARKPREKWRREIARIEGNIAEIHAHVQERDLVAWRLANLPDIYLEECRVLLTKHLERADIGLLATWAEGDRGVTVQLKRLSGLAAKREYLDEMRAAWVRPGRETACIARQKFTAKATKLSRPKKARVQVTVPTDFEEKYAAREARREKARALARRIRRFDAYDRFDLAQPHETWWLHMTDQRRPGVFTPQLAHWYDRNPSVVLVALPDEGATERALAATEALALAGDVS